MIINISGTWRVRSDPLQWIVEKRVPGASAARHAWRPKAYCKSFDHAVIWCGRRQVLELPGEYSPGAFPLLAAKLDAIVEAVREAVRRT